jgi:hypothetical protein
MKPVIRVDGANPLRIGVYPMDHDYEVSAAFCGVFVREPTSPKLTFFPALCAVFEGCRR